MILVVFNPNYSKSHDIGFNFIGFPKVGFKILLEGVLLDKASVNTNTSGGHCLIDFYQK